MPCDEGSEKMKKTLICLLLALALAGLFCWRVATTDPRWRARQMPAAGVQGQ